MPRRDGHAAIGHGDCGPSVRSLAFRRRVERGGHRSWRLAPLACLSVAAAVVGARGLHADELSDSVARLRAEYAAALEDLAAQAEAQGLAAEADAARHWLAPGDPYEVRIPALDDRIGPPPAPPGASAAALQWRERFLQRRAKQAEAYFELARRVVRRRPSAAFELVLMAARENPNHPDVRRVLGYEPYEGRWRTFWEARQLKAGRVDDERFGWLPADWVARYHRGERMHQGRWISAEEDARLHATIEQGWDVETEHYAIRTNHGIEAGVALGRKLEAFLRAWQQLFIRYYATEGQVVALFDGRARGQRAEVPRLAVVHFRDREDYNRSLRAAVPNVEITIGMYLERMRRAYFFAGPEADDRTLYHEATHQLFHQSRPVAPYVGRRANFWIVEGAALLMESFRREGPWYVVGGVDDIRFHAARYRLLNDGFFIPFEQAAAMGMDGVQRDPRIATLYSQFTGMAYFLVFHDQGRYRDALVEYLATVYAGRDTPDSLARLAGASFAELDRQYRQFIAAAPAPRSENRAAAPAPKLAPPLGM